jgi:hypothetical protein
MKLAMQEKLMVRDPDSVEHNVLFRLFVQLREPVGGIYDKWLPYGSWHSHD